MEDKNELAGQDLPEIAPEILPGMDEMPPADEPDIPAAPVEEETAPCEELTAEEDATFVLPPVELTPQEEPAQLDAAEEMPELIRETDVLYVQSAGLAGDVPPEPVAEISDPAAWEEETVVVPGISDPAAWEEETVVVPGISDPAAWEEETVVVPEISDPAAREEETVVVPEISDPAAREEEIVVVPEISDPSAWEEETVVVPEISDPSAWEEETVVVPEISDPAAWEEENAIAPETDTEKQESKKMSPKFPVIKKRAKKPIPRKGRPRRKRGEGLLGIPHLLAALLWLAVIVAIGTSLGKLLWAGAADVLAFGRESKMVTVSIVDSDSIDTIAAKLQEVGLVKYPELFKLYASITGSEEEITTGTFELNTNLDYHALTNALSPSSSNRTVVKVTIPEGFSCRQIFNLLASNNVCSVAALEEYAASGELPEYWFLEGIQRGDRYCLEGFLFPDTYEFYVNSTPKEALGKMLSGFNVRFSDDLRAQIDSLNTNLAERMRAAGKDEEFIAANMFDVYDVLIVASLIEEETASSSESATIASVIYNRLYSWGENPPYLNIDATIYYALDGNIDPVTGNTMVLTSEDLLIDSPYNTYKYTGLTPGPISNPGLTSLQAALAPESTGYFYYVLNPETGMHQFSKTLEEHEKWVQEFYHSGE